MNSIDTQEEINTVSLDALRKHMWNHSNQVIDNILAIEKEANLWMTEEIKNMIKWHIISFLKQKAAIAYDYEQWNESGDTQHFENREKYRENIWIGIELIRTKQNIVEEKNNKTQTIADKLTEVLVENNT